jgi:hypothetical protein
VADVRCADARARAARVARPGVLARGDAAADLRADIGRRHAPRRGCVRRSDRLRGGDAVVVERSRHAPQRPGRSRIPRSRAGLVAAHRARTGAARARLRGAGHRCPDRQRVRRRRRGALCAARDGHAARPSERVRVAANDRSRAHRASNGTRSDSAAIVSCADAVPVGASRNVRAKPARFAWSRKRS